MQARADAWEATLRALMQIASSYDPKDAAQRALRDQLMLPFVQMTEQLRQAAVAMRHASRKPAPDAPSAPDAG